MKKVEKLKKEINIWLDNFKNNINKDLIKIEEFNIDNQAHGHIYFIYAFTNLKSENYNIEKCETYKGKNDCRQKNLNYCIHYCSNSRNSFITIICFKSNTKYPIIKELSF